MDDTAHKMTAAEWAAEAERNRKAMIRQTDRMADRLRALADSVQREGVHAARESANTSHGARAGNIISMFMGQLGTLGFSALTECAGDADRFSARAWGMNDPEPIQEA